MFKSKVTRYFQRHIWGKKMRFAVHSWWVPFIPVRSNIPFGPTAEGTEKHAHVFGYKPSVVKASFETEIVAASTFQTACVGPIKQLLGPMR